MRRALTGFALAVVACTAERQDAGARASAAWSEPIERKGDLVLACEPKDAQVQVDGVPRGLCEDFGRGRGLMLGAGMHRVDVTKEGYEPYQTYCEPSGAQAALAVTLHPGAREGVVR